MGITGLLPFLKSIATNVNVKEYSGQRVAVDAYCWLHKGAYACSFELCQNIPTDKYINYCLHRVNLLRHNNIIPILVFDGGPLPNKRLQEEKRRARRQEHRAKALNFLQQGNRAAANECFKKAVDITPLMAHRLIKILQQEGVECIVAPYEADAQLAFLAHTGYVHAIITEDSDLLPYGCTRVLFKMDQWGDGQEINLKNLALNTTLSFENWTMEMFRNMCILSGCDYLPSIAGLGLKKAYSLINKYKEMDRVFRCVRADRNLVLPPDYIEGFTKAEQTFLHQRVFDHITKKLVPLTPFPEHIDENAMDFLGPLISDEIAYEIAMGNMDPYSFKFFEQSASAPSTMHRSSGPSPSPAVGSVRGRRHFPALRRSLSRPLLLPPQKNIISNYFTPTSRNTLKPFAPPRSSQEEDSADSVNSSEGETLFAWSTSQSDASQECGDSSGSPNDTVEESECGVSIEMEDSVVPDIPSSPPLKSLKRPPDNTSSAGSKILVARTPSPPRTAKRRRLDDGVAASVGKETEQIKVVVTSRFFTTTGRSSGPARPLAPALAQGATPEPSEKARFTDSYEQSCSPMQSKGEKLEELQPTNRDESDPFSRRVSLPSTQLIDLTDDAPSFASPLTTTKRLSMLPGKRDRTLQTRSTSLVALFQKCKTMQKPKPTLQDDGVEVVLSEPPANALTSPYFS